MPIKIVTIGRIGAHARQRESCSRCNRNDYEEVFFGNKVHCKRCRRNFRLKAKYGLTLEEVEQAIEELSGVCPICMREPDAWAVDHDHACCPDKYKTCGKCVRGFICTKCNSAIGFLKDSSAGLRRAADYLDSWSQRLI